MREENIPSWKIPALLGTVLLVASIGGLGGAAAIATLDSAVVAPGVIMHESIRAQVSHLEAGTIQKIYVHEGQLVHAGQVLIRLDDAQVKAQIEGLIHEREAAANQLKFIESELAGVRQLWQKRLVAVSKLDALERDKARLEGVRDEMASKLTAANDTLAKMDIVAPITGTVQAVRTWSIGQTVKSAETLLEIAPQSDRLIIQAHISPKDREHVHEGMNAELRFSSLFQSNLLPMMNGTVETVSQDRLVDESNPRHEPYYLAQVKVTDVPAAVHARLTAGMNAEVVLPTGERSIMSYLVEPLRNRIDHSMHEM
jgi:RND family efflux transporter MFP subunit